MLRLLVVLVGCLSSGGVSCANEQALKAVLFDSAGELVGSAVWHTDIMLRCKPRSKFRTSE
jgi:hypothetical protein